MAQFTLTTTPQLIASGPAPLVGATGPNDDFRSRDFVIGPAPSATGTVRFEPSSTVDGNGTPVAPDMSQSGRISIGAMGLNYNLEPGVYLWARAETGTVAVDVIPGGNR